MKIILHLSLLVVIIAGCSSAKQGKNDLASINIRINYPDKEIILTDIADISYVSLNSDSDDYLYSGGIRYVTQSTIVIYDYSSGSILFFSKDGKPKSRFNHRGRGPGEYIDIRQIVYDEITDEVYITDLSPYIEYIQVYSSTGNYIRKITVPNTSIGSIINFDEQSLLVYNERYELAKNSKNSGIVLFPNKSENSHSSPFLLISKTDGKILDYIDIPQNDIVLKIDGNNHQSWFPARRVIKCIEGALLCHPEVDTVFLYSKDKSIAPVIHKTPLVSDSDPMIVLNNCMDAGKYQFLEIVTLARNEDKNSSTRYPTKYYVRDKNGGKVFQQKSILPEYAGKEFSITGASRSDIDHKNEIYIRLSLTELKQAYSENKLSGKLKDLVTTLKDDDNDVIMFINFKE